MSRQPQKHCKPAAVTINAWLGLFITLAINALSLAYTGGVTLTRLAQVEETIRTQNKRLEDMNSLSNKMAGVEAQLTNINATLGRLDERLSRKAK